MAGIGGNLLVPEGKGVGGDGAGGHGRGAQGLGSGQYNYDATVFAWSYTSLARTGGEAQVITGGNANFNGYTNAKVDSDYKKLEVGANYLTGDVQPGRAGERSAGIYPCSVAAEDCR